MEVYRGRRVQKQGDQLQSSGGEMTRPKLECGSEKVRS